MVPDNAPSKASLLKWWSQFTHAQKPKKFPEYNSSMFITTNHSKNSPQYSILTRAPPCVRQTAQGLPQTGQRANIYSKRQRRPLCMGLHPRCRRKVVRLCLRPLSHSPHSLPPAVSISRKTVHPTPSSIHTHSCTIATEIEGTFRVNGSAKRMRELQAAFETPPRVRITHPPIKFYSTPS